MYTFIALAVIVTAVVVAIYVKFQELTKKAEFYKHLHLLWQEISADCGGHACYSPATADGIAYINSIWSKRRRRQASEDVYRALHRNYYDYLHMVLRGVERLSKENRNLTEVDRDKALYSFLTNSGSWLRIPDSDVYEWHDRGKVSVPKGTNRVREKLLEELRACEKRLEAEKLRQEQAEKERKERARRFEKSEYFLIKV